MNTRTFYDDYQTIDSLDISTGPTRYHMNVPGNPLQIADDPHIRLQKFSGTFASNQFEINSSLHYTKPTPPIDSKYYEHNTSLTTDQSRATHPAWSYREHNNHTPLQIQPYTPPIISFTHNTSTRNELKDNFYKK